MWVWGDYEGWGDLMVPVGEGMGDTKGEVRVVSILRGCVMGEMGGGRRGGISSIREVRASLIWVDGNLMMQLQKRGSVSKSVQERVSETRHRPSRVFLTSSVIVAFCFPSSGICRPQRLRSSRDTPGTAGSAPSVCPGGGEK